MFQHNTEIERAFHISRLDPTHLLSTVSPHSIQLEGQEWISCEHYYQAKSLRNQKHAAAVTAIENPLNAYKYGAAWYRPKQKNLKSTRRILMSRALYTKAQMYEEVREALLATGEERIVETSLYDLYWGIGRDQRGENMLGQVWMDIRRKLASEAQK